MSTVEAINKKEFKLKTEFEISKSNLIDYLDKLIQIKQINFISENEAIIEIEEGYSVSELFHIVYDFINNKLKIDSEKTLSKVICEDDI